jgi:dienelactone hydrolase
MVGTEAVLQTETCDRLAEQGFTVLAPDLRDGQIAKTIEEAKALMEKSDGQLVGDTVMTAKDHLRGSGKRARSAWLAFQWAQHGH